jgi:dTDP-4-amino-4,6-dideoxygalactose transaminase
MQEMLKINDIHRHHEPLQGELVEAAAQVLAAGWYVLGPCVEAFERAFARACGTAHAVGVASGTDALVLALIALDIGPGDEVITAANAGMYSTAAIVAVGATPVFSDVSLQSMSLDPNALDPCISARCKAIIVTHLYGRLADMDAILPIAQARGLPVIEDSAQAHGAARGGRVAGSLGTLGCFSFYPTKNLGACGDGGAVTTSNADLAARVRRLRQYGWAEKYKAVDARGRNSRLDELQAAFLLRMLPHLSRWNARRVAIAEHYSASIRHPLIEVPEIDGSHVAHLYVVQTDQRDAFRRHLDGRGVGTDVHYPIPDHRQPALAERFRGVCLPRTELLCDRVVTLPCFPEMTDEEVEQVITACTSWEP